MCELTSGNILIFNSFSLKILPLIDEKLETFQNQQKSLALKQLTKEQKIRFIECTQIDFLTNKLCEGKNLLINQSINSI